jgi:hypothetical protein
MHTCQNNLRSSTSQLEEEKEAPLLGKHCFRHALASTVGSYSVALGVFEEYANIVPFVAVELFDFGRSTSTGHTSTKVVHSSV